MKILKSAAISSFGGLNFVINELDRKGVGDILNNHLPRLSAQSQYTWRDLIYSFWSIFFCGGDCAEDLSLNLREAFNSNPFVKIPSADRVLERMKDLSKPSECFQAPRGHATHHFSINTSLNALNLKLIHRLSTVKRRNIVLDYDNTLLFCRKADAAMTYKKEFGYAPGVGIIGNNIVYVENRNGNSAAANLQEETLERMFCLLKENGMQIDKFRADGASYKLSTLHVVKEHVNKFYIRANMSQSLTEAITQIEDWKEVVIDNEVAYRGSVVFTPFEKIAERKKTKELIDSYRLVVTKIIRKDGQYNLFTGEPCNYHAIITNDYDMSDNQVIHFYNQRGTVEREFDVLKNDFGWNKMPFSILEHNTVFLILSAMCRNIYQYVITCFSKIYKNLSVTFRIKKFIFRFICIPAKWVFSARTRKLRIYGNLPIKI